MFIAKVKMVAAVVAAIVVGGAGVTAIVAQEVAQRKAAEAQLAPVSAQAEQKSPSPTPATNAAATIAWGEAVNGLQAGLLPAGGGESRHWEYEFGTCRNCKALSGKPTVSGKCPECGSARTYDGWLCFDCAQAQRVCRGCRKPRPSGATFVEGEPIFLEVHVKNVGSEKRNAAPPFLAETMGWDPVFQPTGGGDDLLWRRRPGAVLRRGIPARIPLEPQKEHVWVAVLNDDVGFAFQAASGTEPKTFQQLPPGKYGVIMNCARDKLATGLVEIEIVPATTGAVKHAFGQLPLEKQKTLGNEVFDGMQSDTAKEIKAQSGHAKAQLDPERAKRTTVVLRVGQGLLTTGQYVGGKQTAAGTSVRILDVFKNEGPEKLARDKQIEILWDPRDKGLPATECTVYLEAYRGENWKRGLYSYRFVGANAFADQTMPGNSKAGISHMAVKTEDSASVKEGVSVPVIREGETGVNKAGKEP